eukprot:1373845-Rhodomonas_salina.1
MPGTGKVYQSGICLRNPRYWESVPERYLLTRCPILWPVFIYETPSTGKVYQSGICLRESQYWESVPERYLPTRCPVLTQRMVVQEADSSEDEVWPILLRAACYAMCGTDLAYDGFAVCNRRYWYRDVPK